MADAEAKAAGTRSDAARLEAEVAAAQERISAIDARVPQLTDEKKQAAASRKCVACCGCVAV